MAGPGVGRSIGGHGLPRSGCAVARRDREATTPRGQPCPSRLTSAEQFGVNVKTVRNAVASSRPRAWLRPSAVEEPSSANGHPCDVLAQPGTQEQVEVRRQRCFHRGSGGFRSALRANGSDADRSTCPSTVGRRECWVSNPTARSTRVDVSSGWKEGRLTRSITTRPQDVERLL